MKKWVVANWKMNGSQDLLNAYKNAFSNLDNIIVCPPFVYMDKLDINLGAQNVHYLQKGAYTGEISAQILADAGVNYCLVGHSERRQFFNESDGLVKTKAEQCQDVGITPIICIGESLNEYLNGQTNQVLSQQLNNCLPSASKFWVAYEPLWAIGTGKTPTMPEIEAVHDMLRIHLPRVVLLYGGSVGSTNAAEIFTISNVDGVLVGSASLDIETITKIYGLA